MKITIAQLNSVVGDVDGNLKKITEVVSASHTDLVVFPELFLTGYPPQDLLENRAFLEKVAFAVQDLCRLSLRYPETGIICGAPTVSRESRGKALFNSALLISGGEVLFQQDQIHLQTQDIFDEARYFLPGQTLEVIEFKGEKLGITLSPQVFYEEDDSALLASLTAKGATLIINISASPYHLGKEDELLLAIQRQAKKYALPFIYLNQVGANDELVFEGASMAVDCQGKLILIAPQFQEYIGAVDPFLPHPEISFCPPKQVESVYQGLTLGISDYMAKTGFTQAVLGLSGGIDSALVACLAVEAVGKENVLGIALPSPYSSAGSVEDSRTLADNLGIDFRVISISEIFTTYCTVLEKEFAGKERDVTEENLQARIRGDILMAFSNKFGRILLSTGNKSEVAVGYSTLYGDMCGGLSVLADVPKTMVYELARYINREREVVPVSILEKAPSAELRPDQRDEDSLPPYSLLDEILCRYIERGQTLKDLIKEGFDPEVVRWVLRTVGRSEYKRRQAAPGIRMTCKAFGKGRRMPIAARYDFETKE